jgi:hypothetical protein
MIPEVWVLDVFFFKPKPKPKIKKCIQRQISRTKLFPKTKTIEMKSVNTKLICNVTSQKIYKTCI